MSKQSIEKGKQRKSGRGTNPKSLENLKSHPGRPKGSKNRDGLGSVLQMLKDLVTEKKNMDKIKKAMQTAINKNPLGFYYRFVMPLYSKTIDLNAPDLMGSYTETMREIFNKAENGAKKKT